ncbi:MAG: isoleucine--tRNA ligase [Firmicutes bacterium]|nr:isoleucine--tRNA ligase [Bacillota bacterium]
MPADYNATLQLPKTDFPMRAALSKREPDMLKAWAGMDLYHRIQAKNAEKPRFVLHDGPPFSNGDIHMGHALNKCVKDFIVRYKSMAGYLAPYVPGWDNHGMPIESAIIKQNKLDRKKMSVSDFRDSCRDFAQKYVDIQREQFIRLGVLGEWENPYLTMDPVFEAGEARVFGEMYQKGYIYKGKKPVYWCCHDETALAEAEIEYEEDRGVSIYVKFPVLNDKGKLSAYGDVGKMSFVIWTTTTWTIPGNLALSLGADFDYILAEVPSGEIYIMAKELAGGVLQKAGIAHYKTLATLKGRDFELMTARHPLYDRESVVLNGAHVTLEAGTGCVHTAPGHGREDFDICQKYDREGKTRIGILVPVDDHGIMTAESGKYEGLFYAKANDVIRADLDAAGVLLHTEEIVHQYAHCWRCKKPILYRATDQWFCSVDAIKARAMEVCADVTWLPGWGYERMLAMIRERADWCISRQRHWGLPIPVFYCADCQKPVCTPETIDRVAAVFEQSGSNAWFDREAEDLLPEHFTCPHCGGASFTKETDTLDGWFDAGSSHIVFLERDDPKNWPADLFLEGPDQYRGWFQSSLLTSVAVKGEAPYRGVVMNGWTVDSHGKSMHKSAGNNIAPEELIPTYGAELIRLWAASADYHMEMTVADATFRQLSEIYLKIRNTARYMLGNLNGFDPDHLTAFSGMLSLDQWALCQLDKLVNRCLNAYAAYDFVSAVHAIHRFCVTEMSNFYLDVIKDRLYCDGADSFSRKSGQSALYQILDSLTRLLAPILAFTSNEIWLMMPHDSSANPEHVMLNDMPAPRPEWAMTPETEETWALLLTLRDDVNKVLESERGEKRIGKPLDAKIELFAGPEGETLLRQLTPLNLAELFIVSEVEIFMKSVHGTEAEVFTEPARGAAFTASELPGLSIRVRVSEEPKCARCWTHSRSVGDDHEHPVLCARCAEVVKYGS